MTYSLTWLPSVLLDAKLKVAEVDGWRDRGVGDVGPIYGVLCHHTAGPKKGNMPSLGLITNGRPDLKGPLSQLGLGRDGTFYVIAAGKANHAGKGTWMGASNGNQSFIGIEAENTGLSNDPWPAVQMDAYQRGVAAILKQAGLGPERCAGHKEYALPRGRKIDPSFDMSAFRSAVAGFMNGAPIRPMIPAAEPARTTGTAPRRTLRRGATDPSVSTLRVALGLPASNDFDAVTEAKVREFQRAQDLVPDGIWGPKSWAALDARK